jgi:hypothetical protein
MFITALFWTVTQRVVVISYRRFETIYRFHLQGQESENLVEILTLKLVVHKVTTGL